MNDSFKKLIVDPSKNSASWKRAVTRTSCLLG